VKVTTKDILHAVGVERDRQNAKWGEQNHKPDLWLTILMEEVGEAAKAYLDSTYKGESLDRYRDELVQVAAVAVAMLESYERNEGKPKPPAHCCGAQGFGALGDVCPGCEYRGGRS
jgi:NTP pyrophosphatase (non-canonical NTP hydrolase)